MNRFQLQQKVYQQKLSREQFRELSRFIETEVGIKMPEDKKIMLEGRLRKRLMALGLDNFDKYCNYLFSPEGRLTEMPYMIDHVTTHKTDFFREPGHFEFLVKHILPRMIAVEGTGLNRRLMVWSAGCSTGEEAYSLAMVLSDFGEQYPGFRFDFMILATDISGEVLEQGKQAVYTEESIEPVPMHLRRKFLMKHKDPTKKTIRIIPALRNRVRFRKVNLMEYDFDMREPFDIVFTRNVMIYFKPDRQKKILESILQHLYLGGYLFLGHSENIHKLNLPLEIVAPSVYQKTGG